MRCAEIKYTTLTYSAGSIEQCFEITPNIHKSWLIGKSLHSGHGKCAHLVFLAFLVYCTDTFLPLNINFQIVGLPKFIILYIE